MNLTQLIELLASCITILVLDFKGDFIDVPNRLGKDRWRHFSATDGFHCALGPPLICHNHINWLSQYTKILAAHCNLLFSEATLATVIRIALTLLNPVSGGIVVWPSLLLIEQMLQYLPIFMIAKKEEYLRTLQQKIEYLRRISGTLFDNETGFDFYEHLVKNKLSAVIDCTQLDPLQSALLANLLYLNLLFPRISLRLVSQKLNTVFIADESDSIISEQASRIYPDGYNVAGQGHKQSREFGINNYYGMSFLNNCSQFISANTTYHVVMTQTDPPSIHQAAHTLLIPEGKQLISSLQIGQGIYKESMGPVSHGILIQTKYVEPAHSQRPEHFDEHPFTPARGIDDIPGFREKLDQLIAEYKASTFRQNKNVSKPKLNPNERTFLDLMSIYELELLYQLFARMDDIAPATQQKILKKLEKVEFIEVEQIRTSKSSLRFGIITEKGWQFLQKQPRYKKTRGGPAHQSLCHYKMLVDLKQGALQSGCDLEIPGTTGCTDILTKKTDGYHCNEVIIHCESNILKHARDCFIESKQIKSLTFITCLKSDHEPIRAQILSNSELVFHISKIYFSTIEQLLNEYKEIL